MKSYRFGALALMLAVGAALPLLAPGMARADEGDVEPLCPSHVMTAGLPVSRPLEPTGAYGYQATVVGGALPDGLVIANGVAGIELTGTPLDSSTGEFRFRVQLQRGDDRASIVSADCLVDVAPRPVVRRLDALDRYAESVAISREVAPLTAPLVYLASGEGFADALSASSIAGNRRAPLLLTGADALPAVVQAELERLQPEDVVIVGGEDTVRPAVAVQLTALSAAPAVHRIAGPDRFAVSAALLAHPDFGLPSTRTSPRLYLASGNVFPDALSATPAAVSNQTGVLLIDGTTSRLEPEAAAALDELGVSEVKILGGEATVSADLHADLAHRFESALRIGGADRYWVSRRVNKASFPPQIPRDEAFVATGATFPDALAGGVLAGVESAPLVLAPTTCILRDDALYLGTVAPDRITLLGGRVTLTDSVADLSVCP